MTEGSRWRRVRGVDILFPAARGFCESRNRGMHARVQSLLKPKGERKEDVMLYWAAVFFVIALIAGGLGFGGIAAAAAGIAQTLR